MHRIVERNHGRGIANVVDGDNGERQFGHSLVGCSTENHQRGVVFHLGILCCQLLTSLNQIGQTFVGIGSALCGEEY